MIKFKHIQTLAPKLLLAIDGLDEDIACSFLMDSAVQCMRDTQAIRQTLCIELKPPATAYPLKTPLPIYEVLSITSPIPCEVHGDVLYVQDMCNTPTPPCKQGGFIYVTVSLVCLVDDDKIPDELYEKYGQAIIHKALSQLFLMYGKSWYNIPLAREHERLYKDFVKKSRVHRVTKHNPLVIKLQPRVRTYL